MNANRAAVALTSLIALAAGFIHAAPFAEWIETQSPGGKAIRIWGEGDEFSAWFEAEDGHAVVYDVGRRAYTYAEKDPATGELLSTGIAVGEEGRDSGRIRALPLHMRDASKAAEVRRRARIEDEERACGTRRRWNELKQAARYRREYQEAQRSGKAPLMAPPSSSTVGEVVGLTILVDFPVLNSSGEMVTTLRQKSHPGITREIMEQLMNGESFSSYGNASSVRKYYEDVSCGRLRYTNVVLGWFVASKPREYYDDPTEESGPSARELIGEVFDQIAKSPDSLSKLKGLSYSGSEIKALNVWFAGPSASVWSKGLWAHKWCLLSEQYSRLPLVIDGETRHFFSYQISPVTTSPSIGTVCHENGHMICDFPDLYNYNYGSGRGSGGFSLMGRSGDKNPVYVDAYLRIAAGWVEPKVISGGETVRTVRNDRSDVWKFANENDPAQYYLVENRQRKGRDANIPADGILILRCDENGSDTYPQRLTGFTGAAANRLSNELSIEQADGLYEIEKGSSTYGDAKDTWYKGNTAAAYKGEFSDSTVPCALWKNASKSGLRLWDFSQSGDTMTFRSKTSGEEALLDIAPGTASVDDGGGAGYFTVNCTAEWTASTDSSWVRVQTASGTKNGTVYYTFDGNGSSATRSAQIKVVSGNLSRVFTLRQSAHIIGGEHFTINGGVLTAWDGKGTTDLVIPEGVTEISDKVFYMSDVTSVRFPSSLKTIGESAFGICYDLTNLTFSSGLETVGGQAFAFNQKLTGLLVLPEGLKTIGYCAFSYSGCSWIVIPSSVSEIAWGAFESSTNLERVYFRGNAPAHVGWSYSGAGSSEIYRSTDAGLTTFVPYGSSGWTGTGTSLPGVWPVGDGEDARGIAHYSPSAPPLALSANSGSYSSSAQTQSVAVKAISFWSARSSAGWISMKTGSGSGFGTVAFTLAKNTSALAREATIMLTSGSTTVSYQVTQRGTGDVGLEHFTIVDGVLTAWDGKGPTDVVIPAAGQIREIGEKAFYVSRALTSVVIGDGIRKIGKNAFGVCGSLTNVVFGSSIEEIADFAFALDGKLKGRLVLPDSLVSIGMDAFWETGYSSVIVPSGVQSIGRGAFQGCASLLNVYFKGNAPASLGAWYSDTTEIYAQTPTGLVTHVPYGSSGWNGGGTTSLPSVWPVSDGEDARAIRNYYVIEDYSIAVDLDGGQWTGRIPEFVRREEWIGLPAPTKAGFVFAGWQAVSGLDPASARYSADGVSVQGWTSPWSAVGAGADGITVTALSATGAISLRALWTKVQVYDIRYQLDGGAFAATAPTRARQGEWLVLPSPVRAGFDFGGWQAVSGLDTSCASVSVDGVQAYNWWPFDAVVGAGLDAFIISNLARDGGEVTLRALWNARTYSIRYQLDGGTSGANTPSTLGEGEWAVLPSPVRPGYSFGGWQAVSGLDMSCAVVSTDGVTAYQWWPSDAVVGAGLDAFIVSDLARAHGQVTLRALWQANAYSINYWLGGGTLSANTPTSARPGEWFILPSPTRPGYSFGGWQAISGLDSACAVVSTDGAIAYQWWPSDAVVGAGLTAFIVSDLTRAGGAVMLMALWNYAWPVADGIVPKPSAASDERSLPSGEYLCRLEDTGDFGMIGIGTPDAEGFMPIRLELDMEGYPLAGCGTVEDGVLVARFEDGRTISFVRSDDGSLLGSIFNFNLTHKEGEQTK